ncbi:Dps family protein [Microbaculum marinisediminis]|uniref:DNA starvation/stationary phase protection protein n=1 Tax=Microbaculum marinisediminis TaxID=2931392 RepID=A0AAW5R019_9HYPH|nr:DNA starvation/stationary phase protection protein [Microbaculum sp. A6E488]MCT8973646.1 DNA starvation/stationary phase protection protein [Microbaculum sp. A6E488]
MTRASNVLKVKPHREDVHTGIPAADRKTIAEAISGILADTYVLVIKSHVYHWNVVGPLFQPLHEMTEDHYQNLFEACDDLAERIRALGHTAPLTDRQVLGDSAIRIDKTAPTAGEMIKDLIADHEGLCRKMREAAETAEQKGDFVSHDLLTGRLTYHEKAVWMLRAIIAD